MGLLALVSLASAFIGAQAPVPAKTHQVSYQGVSLAVPLNWRRSGNELLDQKGREVASFGLYYPTGELTGPNFVSTYQRGFYGEPERNQYVKSGQTHHDGQTTYWVCRKVVDENDKDGSGSLRFERTFQLNLGAEAHELHFYSFSTCDDNFRNILAVVASAKTSR
ncbi:hypothetical protein [Gallaecimonas mangrovi]|uniref:hypothetical protein n=1 Tax=Gallaecimonas mangrovi TaxID=2291597 RepID=UPI000E206AC9|nr:hypothetical protein [Gallaecimonas mangrovi]